MPPKLSTTPDTLQLLMDGWLAYLPALGNASTSGGVVAGGYFIPTLQAPEGSHMSFLLAFNGTVAQAEAALTPLGDWIATVPQYLTLIGAQFLPFPSLVAVHEYWDPTSEPTGNAITLGSRLIPADLLHNDSTRSAIAVALTEITYTVGGMTGMLVAGGAVAAADPGSAATSINPAWRTAGAHIAFGAGWALNTSLAEIEAIFQGVSQLTDLLRATCDQERGPASYWSERCVCLRHTAGKATARAARSTLHITAHTLFSPHPPLCSATTLSLTGRRRSGARTTRACRKSSTLLTPRMSSRAITASNRPLEYCASKVAALASALSMF